MRLFTPTSNATDAGSSRLAHRADGALTLVGRFRELIRQHARLPPTVHPA